MAFSQLMVDYLGYGLAADRPVSPNIAPGVAAVYLSTDSSEINVWDGSAWTIFSSGGGTVTGGSSEGSGVSIFDSGSSTSTTLHFRDLQAGTNISLDVQSDGAIRISAASLTQTIASGTAALGTSAIGSGASATVVTVSATGVLTADTVDWGFNGDPTGVTGYTPSASGMLTIIAYPTADHVNFVVCNNTGSSVTPGAITLNWRVLR